MSERFVVYVAGPFRADNSWEIEQNIRRAETVALEVWKLGVAAICPHANSRFYQGVEPDDVWLAGDLVILERCDAVLLVTGWESSEGTLAEIERAEELGIPVFEVLGSLMAYLKVGHPKQRQDVLKMLGQASDFDEYQVNVSTSRSAMYRAAMSSEVWSLLYDLYNDARQTARGKTTENEGEIVAAQNLLGVLVDGMRERGIDLDVAFS